MNVNLTKILQAAMLLIAEYRAARDKVVAAGNPTDPNTGAVLSDQELIDLLAKDADAAAAHIDELIAKHTGGGQ